MARAVIALPEFAQTVLTPDIPYLEIHIRKCYRRDILADCWDRLKLRCRVRGEVERLDLLVEGGFAGIVEAEEENGVLYSIGVSILDRKRE